MENSVLINSKELAQLLNVAIRTISYHVAVGNLPTPVSRHGNKGQEMVFDKSAVAQALGVADLNEGFLRMEEAARIMGVDVETIKSLCSHKLKPLPHYSCSHQHGSRFLFRKSDLETYRQHDDYLLIKEGHRHTEKKLDFVVQVFTACLENTNFSDGRTWEVMKSFFAKGNCLQEIADEHGLTKERIRQIIFQAKQELIDRLKYFGQTDKMINDLTATVQGLRAEVKELSLLLGEKIRDASQSDRIIMIADLNVSVRVRNCLNYLGIQTLNELAAVRSDYLLKLRNFGIGSLSEVKALMHRNNFKFIDE